MVTVDSTQNKKLSTLEPSDSFHPDEMDRRIIRILSTNGRASFTEIAELIGVTPATVRNRLNRLIDSNIIKNFKPLLDKKLYKLDINAFIMISLESRKIIEEVVTELQDFEEIQQISILAHNPNIICTVFTHNMEEFSALLLKITQIEGIRDLQSNFILKSIIKGAYIQ